MLIPESIIGILVPKKSREGKQCCTTICEVAEFGNAPSYNLGLREFKSHLLNFINKYETYNRLFF